MAELPFEDDVCECFIPSHLGVVHTLKLPQHQRMSLGRPSLPPIPSESGNETIPAEYHTQQRVSCGYVGVEPPRYDQVARGSGQEPQKSPSGGPSTNPPTYNMDEAHGSGLRPAPSSEAVGDYFREPQQFASSVEIHTAAMEGVKSGTMKKLVRVAYLVASSHFTSCWCCGDFSLGHCVSVLCLSLFPGVPVWG